MPSVTFDLATRGGGSVRAAVRGVVAEAKRASADVTKTTIADANRAGAAQRHASTLALKQAQLQTRAHLQLIAGRQRGERQLLSIKASAERQATALAAQQTNLRLRLAQQEEAAKIRAATTSARAVEQSERTSTRVTEREAKRRADAEIRERRRATRQANNNGQRNAQRDNRDAQDRGRADTRVARDFGRRAADNGRAALQWGRRGLEFVGQQGDAVRDNITRARSLEDTATGISVDAAGDSSLTRQLLAVAQREGERTGISPEEVLAALGRAQSMDSVLADPSQRATYLSTVLPQLVNTAGASGGSLEEIAASAVEFRRQHGISNADLPQRLASAVMQSRSGAISFADFASHGGVLGGAASRFMASEGAGGARTADVTGALFQMAGRAGGSGDEASTRARAFLDNFASGRGQRRLRAAIGHGALDNSGQLQTNAGESQSDALMRVIEEAFRDTGGNNDRFLTAVAGTNTRARSLGDQLFRDLQMHDGRLADTRGLIGAGASATPGSTQDRGAEAVFSTSGAHARQDALKQFYRSLDGADVAGAPGRRQGNASEETMRMIEALRGESPWAASLVDTSIGRGVLDVFNQGRLNSDNSNALPAAGNATTRRQQIHNESMRQAAANLNETQDDWGPLGSIVAALRPESMRQSELQQETSRLEQSAIARERAAGRDPDAPLALAPDTISRLAGAIGAAVNGGKSPGQAAAQAVGQARAQATADRNRL